jgi:hypothetical protein
VAGSGETTTLALRGEVDVSTAALLEEALDLEVVREATRLILDLAECAFADSVGLAVVIRTALALGERGGWRTDPALSEERAPEAVPGHRRPGETPECGGRAPMTRPRGGSRPGSYP